MSAASAVCDLMKALRSDWETVHRLRKLTGFGDATVRKWLDELEAQGFVVSREPRGHGVAREFTLSAYWGGVAA